MAETLGVVFARRGHTTPRVSAFEILTTDLGLLYLDIWLDGETVSEDDYDNRQSPWENRQSPWESRLVVGLGSSTTRQSHGGLNNGQ